MINACEVGSETEACHGVGRGGGGEFWRVGVIGEGIKRWGIEGIRIGTSDRFGRGRGEYLGYHHEETMLFIIDPLLWDLIQVTIIKKPSYILYSSLLWDLI